MGAQKKKLALENEMKRRCGKQRFILLSQNDSVPPDKPPEVNKSRDSVNLSFFHSRLPKLRARGLINESHAGLWAQKTASLNTGFSRRDREWK